MFRSPSKIHGRLVVNQLKHAADVACSPLKGKVHMHDTQACVWENKLVHKEYFTTHSTNCSFVGNVVSDWRGRKSQRAVFVVGVALLMVSMNDRQELGKLTLNHISDVVVSGQLVSLANIKSTELGTCCRSGIHSPVCSDLGVSLQRGGVVGHDCDLLRPSTYWVWNNRGAERARKTKSYSGRVIKTGPRA
jgi:hypothetical protein